MSSARQSTLFRGIYEFDDPSGALIAAKVPAFGSVDLYSDTAVVVRPNQCAIFVYKGRIADTLPSGTHRIETENVPILTRLANWKFGFKSPLKAELIFVTGQVFTGRRWGTAQPVLVHLPELGAVPIRSFGLASVAIKDPRKFYMELTGSRTSFSIAELDEFIQGQILEALPREFAAASSLEELTKSYSMWASRIAIAVNAKLDRYGIGIADVQVLSALPSQEVIEAMDAKTSMRVIGDPKEFLLYKAAQSLGEGQNGEGNDPMQMMMGLMLGKNLIDAAPKEVRPIP